MLFFYTVCIVDGFDVIIALDISDSVDEPEFDNLQSFVVEVIATLNIGPNDSLVGVIVFAKKSRFVINLNEYYDSALLRKAINDLPLKTEKGTRFIRVLKLLKDSENDETIGFRPDFPNVAVIVTDGRARDNQTELEMEAAEFHRSSNFTVYTVGVQGNRGADLKELQIIAGNNATDINATAFLIEDLNNRAAFEDLRKTLIERLCQLERKE